MKELKLIAGLLLISFYCSAQTNITIKINGNPDADIFIAYYYGDKQYISDTLHSDENGVSILKKEETMDGGIYMVVIPALNNKYFEFLMAENTFTLETEIDNLDNYRTPDSKENKIFFHYSKTMKKFGLMKDSLMALNLDSTKRSEEFTKLDKQVEDLKDGIVKKHPASFFTKLILTMNEPKIPEGLHEDKLFYYYRDHFFDGVDWSDARLLRSPILHDKVNRYLERLTVQHPDSLIKAVDLILKNASANEEMFKFFSITVLNKYATSKIMGLDAVYVHIVDEVYFTGKASWAPEADVIKIQERAKSIRPTLIGNKAKEVFAYDITGKLRSVYEADTEYTVLLFWDHDCGECKKTAKALNEVYKEKDKLKMEVIAIHVEPTSEQYLNLLTEYGISWISLSDNDHDPKIRDGYDIIATPKIYILNRDKIIIAKNIDSEQVKEVIEFNMSLE